tara:strand:- start:1642 stop:2379 length:738 start_codon:yes stop_codon:yes gene_type:complete
MKFNLLLILVFIIPFHAKSDQIYELIKIPNLEIYDTGQKGIKYLIAGENFSAGVGINSVNCEQTKKDQLKKKFSLIKTNMNFYDKNFLKKVNLKFLILCKNLTVSDIPAIGFANPEMKTVILNIDAKDKIFQRVLHHEIFHIIHKNFKDNFNESKWMGFNRSGFEYSSCSTCKEYVGLFPLNFTDGFYTNYAKTSVSEDMAETFSFLVLNDEYSRKKIKEDSVLKNKTNFIKENMLKIYNGFKFQ